ncbi:hypothetical protein CLV25_102169 [Acetobacteroides hydrogenigenes]|uniref:Uncharacterized protein n=1 Tax=Acetobacteroides hydrogenigenes TaxID=979970 RepID=A0A4R2EWK0_9BACT|nr:hypothetical protein CLV25_102169 [Acetobacteroides hydrogenigenes]
MLLPPGNLDSILANVAATLMVECFDGTYVFVCLIGVGDIIILPFLAKDLFWTSPKAYLCSL